jgi:hypothetical protein
VITNPVHAALASGLVAALVGFGAGRATAPAPNAFPVYPQPQAVAAPAQVDVVEHHHYSHEPLVLLHPVHDTHVVERTRLVVVNGRRDTARELPAPKPVQALPAPKPTGIGKAAGVAKDERAIRQNLAAEGRSATIRNQTIRDMKTSGLLTDRRPVTSKPASYSRSVSSSRSSGRRR